MKIKLPGQYTNAAYWTGTYDMALLPASKQYGRQHLRLHWWLECCVVQGGNKEGQMVWVEVTQGQVKRGEVRMNIRNKFPLGVAKSNLDAFCYTALTLERCWADRKFIIHYYSLIPWTIWLPWAACSSLRHSGRSEGHPGSLPWSCCDDWQGWEYKAWNATQSSGGEDCSCPGVLSGIPIGVHW